MSRRDVRFHVATSFYYSSVTSRREILTSRRQNVTFLSCRDVGFHVATSFGHPLCHVATWYLTSRRQLVMPSATSRRGISRRDVGNSALCHVATWPRTSRRETGFKPGIGHFFWPSLAQISPWNPSSSARRHSGTFEARVLTGWGPPFCSNPL